MKILLVHNYYGSSAPSGENKVFEVEKAMLEKHGHEVEVYTRHSDEIRGDGRVERVETCRLEREFLAAKKAKGAKKIEYLTLYMGNDSAKTKLTVLVGLSRSEEFKSKSEMIVKLGRTEAAAEAIRNEVKVLRKLAGTSLKGQVPVVVGDVGSEGEWTWSVQSVVPKGESPVRMQKEHCEFLGGLRKAGLSHGDFAPWNCSIVGGKLYVWDWEDGGEWVEGKDETWFKGQVKKLLGIES